MSPSFCVRALCPTSNLTWRAGKVEAQLGQVVGEAPKKSRKKKQGGAPLKSNPENTQASEAYEVELEGWLLESLNHGYVIPENFRAHKALRRPTAKGIFGNLLLGRAHFVGTGMDDLPTTPAAFGSLRSSILSLPVRASAFPATSNPVATLGSSMQGSVDVTDCGTAPLTIKQHSDRGSGFSLPCPATCALTIAPTQSCSFPLNFTPWVASNSYGTLTFSSNAPVAQTVLPLYAVGVLGTGPAVVLSTQSMDFGSVQVGSTSNQKMINVMNVGSEPLAIVSITTSGDFSQTNNCYTSVLGNEDCPIYLTFTPTAGGARTGTLTITSNAPGLPQTVPLTGVGQNALTVVPSSLANIDGSIGRQSASTMLQLNAQSGFSGIASLSCAV
jgi:hypothetical protein